MTRKTNKPLRFLRIALAVFLIGISLWALLLPPIFPYSSHAIVNTKAVTIRALAEGVIGELPIARTQVLKEGAVVGRVTRDMVKVRRELEDKQLKRLRVKSRLDSLDVTILERQAKLQAEKTEIGLASAGATRVLEQSRIAAVEKARIHREELADKRGRQARVEPLFKEGIVTASQWSETRAQTLEAERNLAQAEADRVAIEARVATAQRGGDRLGGEAVEGALNRIAAYEREVTDLSIQRVSLAAELGELDQQISLDRSYGEAGQSYALTTPIAGVVWNRKVVPGETVMEGQPVADVADVNAVFAEAYFSRDFINDIAIGDDASIYLISASRYVKGRVADIQMQERSDNDSNVINAMALDNSMLRVQVELTPGALGADSIGQLAKVQISGAKTGWLGRRLVEVSFLLRSRH